MAMRFHRQPSQIYAGGILDEVVALDFDLTCNLRIQIYENAKEKAQAELMAAAMGMGQVNSVFGGGSDDGPVIKYDQM
jgi:hypothetical protein